MVSYSRYNACINWKLQAAGPKIGAHVSTETTPPIHTISEIFFFFRASSPFFWTIFFLFFFSVQIFWLFISPNSFFLTGTHQTSPFFPEQSIILFFSYLFFGRTYGTVWYGQWYIFSINPKNLFFTSYWFSSIERCQIFIHSFFYHFSFRWNFCCCKIIDRISSCCF